MSHYTKITNMTLMCCVHIPFVLCTHPEQVLLSTVITTDLFYPPPPSVWEVGPVTLSNFCIFWFLYCCLVSNFLRLA